MTTGLYQTYKGNVGDFYPLDLALEEQESKAINSVALSTTCANNDTALHVRSIDLLPIRIFSNID